MLDIGNVDALLLDRNDSLETGFQILEQSSWRQQRLNRANGMFIMDDLVVLACIHGLANAAV